MNKINLSFLKHKELPTKEITVKINGEEQTFDITPINGRGMTSIELLHENDLDRSGKLCILALMYGLNISQEEAENFINSDVVAADEIASEIIDFTGQYTEEVFKAKQAAKKNLKEKK